MENQQDKLLAAAMRRLELLKKNDAFDPINVDSRPTVAQQQVIDDFGKIRMQYIVAGNQSGKSQTCARIVTWVITDTHPSWKRPEAWGEEPLLVLVAGKSSKIIEESLLPKLESYLVPNTYKIVRVGNIVQRLDHQNGNRIVFQSYESPKQARERLQSYVAHLAWVDEMPPVVGILDELQRRIQARSGYLLASFTPLIRNEDIRKAVDAATLPYAKKYQFAMFDNPLYASPEKQAEIMAELSVYPEHIRNTRLYGAWTTSDDNVYYFDYDTMVEMADGYSPMWRHVESVDPALKSALGLTIWAENPSNNIWYCVHAEYIKGIYVPTQLVEAVRERTKNFNIVRRIADPHEVWYIQTAASMGISYMGVYKKNERKSELIKGLQGALGQRARICPNSELLISELQECRWSDRADGRIVNSSSYHLLDSAQYFCDAIPKAEQKIVASSHDDWLYKANEQRKAKEELKRKKVEMLTIRRRGRWR